ncbi:MAG: 1-acyl-sn-glycerol-3-phosphate acyltransferase [Cyclobacteriaceae bacterium]|nr:1-acyl-sn-glycerol-3-phosphate acyltransferase [Cyclobacteriaceae bacterium HetDA_MAG_MS6]
MKRLFYIVIKFLCKVSYPIYFGKMDIVGMEHIPVGSPFIYAPNHSNAFLDALVIGSNSPVTSHYITRSDVFKRPTLWFLEALNMIPIYRMRDGIASLAQNEKIFNICQNILLANKSFLIFPEGSHGDVDYLRPLTKGIVRMAFDSQEKMEKDIYIVPVGMNYFKRLNPRHKMIMKFGKPINVGSYLALYQENNAKGYNKLREDIAAGMRDCLIIPDQDEQYEQRRKVFTRENEKLGFDELRRRAAALEVSEEKTYPGLKSIATLLSVFNLGPLLLIHTILKNKVKDIVFYSSIKHVIGLFLLPVWWALIYLTFWLIGGWMWGLSAVAVSIIMLFLRQSLLRLTD